MNDNCSDDLNSWHTNFAMTTDDIQEFSRDAKRIEDVRGFIERN